jgi:ribA/ribD-fused uncharacterized protein
MIQEFQEEYRFLSNFWPANITYKNMTFRSVEHAYQAAKTLNLDERRRIQSCRSPGQAKRLGKTVTIREDWNNIKLRVMAGLLWQKFHIPELREMLLATGDQRIEEGNNWGDRYWGISPVGSGNGRNCLGEIIMAIREDIKNEYKLAPSE